MFSTVAFTSEAIFAIASIPFSENSRSTFSVFNKATYCFIKLKSGSFKIRLKSLLVKASSSTLIGSLPCNSGRRSEGLANWNAPEAIRGYRTEQELRYLIGTGVSAAAVWHLREILNNAGFQKVKIVEKVVYSDGAYWGDPDKMRFRSSVDSFTDATEISDTERLVRTNFSVTLRGYLLPEGNFMVIGFILLPLNQTS